MPGNLTISDSNFVNNQAVGGNGGAGAPGEVGGSGGTARGGDVNSYDMNVTIDHSTFSGSIAQGGIGGAGGTGANGGSGGETFGGSLDFVAYGSLPAGTGYTITNSQITNASALGGRGGNSDSSAAGVQAATAWAEGSTRSINLLPDRSRSSAS